MRWLKDNIATVVAAVCVACALVAAFLVWGPAGTADAAGSGRTALVHDADGATYALPLGTDDILTVTTELGTNTITVQDATVRMTEADCPKGSCLEQRPISRPGEQIICLPHKLWIEVVDDAAGAGTATAMDTDAVTWDADDVDLVAQ